jgi:hypothetical protein
MRSMLRFMLFFEKTDEQNFAQINADDYASIFILIRVYAERNFC